MTQLLQALRCVGVRSHLNTRMGSGRQAVRCVSVRWNLNVRVGSEAPGWCQRTWERGVDEVDAAAQQLSAHGRDPLSDGPAWVRHH